MPVADVAFQTVREKHNERMSGSRKERGAFKGPIKIPSSSSAFFFNDLVFSRIPAKSLKSQPVLFSIPAARTKTR